MVVQICYFGHGLPHIDVCLEGSDTLALDCEDTQSERSVDIRMEAVAGHPDHQVDMSVRLSFLARHQVERLEAILGRLLAVWPPDAEGPSWENVPGWCVKQG